MVPDCHQIRGEHRGHHQQFLLYVFDMIGRHAPFLNCFVFRMLGLTRIHGLRRVSENETSFGEAGPSVHNAFVGDRTDSNPSSFPTNRLKGFNWGGLNACVGTYLSTYDCHVSTANALALVSITFE